MPSRLLPWVESLCLVGLGVAASLTLTDVLGVGRGFAPVMVGAVGVATLRNGLGPGLLAALAAALAFDFVWVGDGRLGTDWRITATSLATFLAAAVVLHRVARRPVPLAPRAKR